MERVSGTENLRGAPPTLEWVPLDRLEIDERYQRATDSPKSMRLVRGMVLCWDWRLCAPLIVSRREDGRLFVVDGQHRLAGARERGDLPHLPCVIAMHADHADEANTFVALNLKRQKLSQGDVFNASLAAGDEAAAVVLDLVERAGLSFARSHSPQSWKPGQLFCGPALMRHVRAHGGEAVSNALVALSEAYAGQVLTRGATIINALMLIYTNDAKRPEFDPDHFIKALGAVEQIGWMDAAEDTQRANPALSRREALAAAFMEVYDELRRSE